ncbi:MAG: M28 family peptidase [Candidatus Bathyarchaeota archaeon]|nr:M28 family peptidase [Candidatus Bathyarchaeota archaeon]
MTPNRRVGSPGNRAATDFFAQKVSSWGYLVDATPFKCLDYESKEPSLTYKDRPFAVKISPYSLGCDANAELVVASTITELETCDCHGKILLIKDEICAEQLMPKNFVFYNPDHHKRIYALLEEKQPKAIITATSKKPQMVGNIYPFPLINDGDFDIPSLYCTDIVGEEIATKAGKPFELRVEAKRIPTTACNVIASKNPKANKKIIICAHIDAVEDSPGASDNASGVAVLMLVAELLKDYADKLGIEIIAFNGEDHYSVAGQMDYLNRYSGSLNQICVAINIDDVGYFKGKTAYSFYECSGETCKKAQTAFNKFGGLLEGEQWYQGDHMIFAQKQIPTIALTAERVQELMATITHSPRDRPEIIDYNKLVEVAKALKSLVISF